ncbi:MAG: YggS family pyridoxal phosphate-dependent enzyme [Bacteroidales bacterium]|nr:YggS family pyridoxal phosphate-dependent enzyme [Bacteroidales bacterium]
MPSIAEKIKELHNQLPAGVSLVAVSKYHPVEQLQEAYSAGQRLFGESHAQELVVKAPAMPADVQWHFIGHLQRNKVRAIMPIVTMIHSVDSIRLLNTIEKEAQRIGREVDVLLQLHVAQEEAKSGFGIDELILLAREGAFQTYEHVRFRGLMAMATFTDDTSVIEAEFASVAETFSTLREEWHFPLETFTEISMGMSDDWPLAVEKGATLVRIGTDIFGPRQY